MDGYHLSPDRAAFVKREAMSEGYADAGAYLSALVDDAAQRKLEAALLDGLHSEELAWTPPCANGYVGMRT